MVIQSKLVIICLSVLAALCAILIALLTYLIRIYRPKCVKKQQTYRDAPNIPTFTPIHKPMKVQPSLHNVSASIAENLDPNKYGSPWTDFDQCKSPLKSISMDNLNIPITPPPICNIGKRQKRKWHSTFHSTSSTPSQSPRFRSLSEPYPIEKKSPGTSSSESFLNEDTDANEGKNQQLITNDTECTAERPPLGEILVALCHNPSEGRLTITIKSAKDLPAVTKSGKIDPFIEIHVYTSGERIYKRKTTIQSDTKTPSYEESFDVVVTLDKMPQTSAILRLYHHGYRAGVVRKNIRIGVIFLGYQFQLYGPHEYKLNGGARHWASAIEKPHLTIEEWHPVQAFSS